MAKKHPEGYLTAKEARKISKANRKITNELEKKRKTITRDSILVYFLEVPFSSLGSLSFSTY